MECRLVTLYKEYYALYNKKDYDNNKLSQQDLEIIGNNNLKALYLGINEKQERKDKGMIESDFKESKKKDSRERNNNNENKDNQTNNRSSINNQNNKTNTKQSRPKLIGRLATTIVDTMMGDGEEEIQKKYESEKEEDLSNIEVVGQNGIDISLVSEYSKNILRQIAKNSNYTRVVISSTARTPRRQAEIMYNNIITKGLQEQRNTYKQPGQRVLDVYEIQKKAGKNKEEIIQAMTNKINELGASNVSKHCADFNVVNVVDIPHSSLGKNKEKFKSEAIRRLGKTNVLDENSCYHIVIHQQN